MKKPEKTIVTCAITGAIHSPCMSPYLPITPEQIATEAIAAAEAGAAIIHLHAREPDTGMPTTDPEIYRQFLEPIKDNCDAIINITTGQPDRQAFENPDAQALFQRRLAAPKEFAPEICSFNMGPMNPSAWVMHEKLKDKYIHEWERLMMTLTKQFTIQNTYDNMQQIAVELGEERGIRFEFECFDIGHLYTLKLIADQGWLKPPYFIQSVMGFAGGLSSDPKHVMHMKQTADDLFGDDYQWSCLATGASQMATVTMAAILGGHVRVGMEDSLWYGKGEPAKSNADQVGRIKRILEELSIDVATPDEARAILQTKGADKTNI